MNLLKNLKAQSAMEYLMTYGWAILIIAVVLGTLFSLGVFSGGALLGTTCLASPGFTCTSLTFLHSASNAIMTFTFGQATGSTWTSNVYFFAVASSIYPWNGMVLFQTTTFCDTLTGNGISSISSGTTTTAPTLTCGPFTAVGTTFTGYIYATYGITSVPVVGTVLATPGAIQVATINVKTS